LPIDCLWLRCSAGSRLLLTD